jgi:Nitrile hydratase beta subunit
LSAGTALQDGFAEPSLPRANGSPVFDAPWQARSLAMAVLVVEVLGCDWDDFRQRLVAAIAAEPERPYWESWVAALEDLVAGVGF